MALEIRHIFAFVTDTVGFIAKFSVLGGKESNESGLIHFKEEVFSEINDFL